MNTYKYYILPRTSYPRSSIPGLRKLFSLSISCLMTFIHQVVMSLRGVAAFWCYVISHMLVCWHSGSRYTALLPFFIKFLSSYFRLFLNCKIHFWLTLVFFWASSSCSMGPILLAKFNLLFDPILSFDSVWNFVFVRNMQSISVILIHLQTV
jgi:hypothetical protein